MKKALAILAAVFVIVSLGGCSLKEANFYQTLKSMEKLDDYSFEGQTKININKFEYKNPEMEMSFLPQSIIDMFKDVDLFYNGTVNSTNKTLDFTLYMKKPDGTTQDLVKLFGEGKNLYVWKGTYEAFMISADDYNGLPIEQRDGKEYVVYDLNEYVKSKLYNIKYYLLSVNPQIEGGKSDEYITWYFGGFDNGVLDAINKNHENETNYNVENMKQLIKDFNDEQIAEYIDAYDLGYLDGDTATKKAMVEKAEELDKIDQDGSSLLKNANAVYFLEKYKGMSFKAMDLCVNKLFNDFTLDKVEKVSDSKYSVQFDADSMKKVMDYINSDEQKMIDVLNEYRQSFSTEEKILMGINPNEILEDMDITNIRSYQNAIENPIIISGDYTIEKTGGVSYEVGQNISMKQPDELVEESGMNFDISFNNKMSINKTAKGDIKVAAAVVDDSASGTSIRLDASDPNMKECGIAYSTSEDFANPVKVEATKQDDGSYLVKLPARSSGSNYYYKTYTVDTADNLLYSNKINTMGDISTNDTTNTTGKSVKVENPKTGDNSSYVLWSVIFGCAVCGMVLCKRKASAVK